ncbi:ubiquitin-like-specific protease ESD4 [Ananas comosus]|uniref:Ubiquitin-like-specific protease ESD4 n=1 Tax=Ananas comosus TaxID=4615 RepID=A0A6P5EZS0_ANACO|nr:ubiquitin-like-specific protease ESD4 [Ananas comosus]
MQKHSITEHPIIVDIPPSSDDTSRLKKGKTLKLKVTRSSPPLELKYYGKGELPKEDQERIEKFLTSTTPSALVLPSKDIDIGRKDLVDLTSHMAFVSSDVINAYQNLLKEAEGDKCIYTTSFLYQTLGTAMSPEMFLVDITEERINEAKYWFIPLFDFEHWHLLAVDLQGGKYLHLSSIKNPKYNAGFEKACKFIGNYLQEHFSDLFGRRGTRPVDWEMINLEDIPMQDQSNDCAIFLLAYEEYLQKGRNLDFCQEDMTRRRGEIAAEFLRLFDT